MAAVIFLPSLSSDPHPFLAEGDGLNDQFKAKLPVPLTGKMLSVQQLAAFCSYGLIDVSGNLYFFGKRFGF